MIVLRDRGYEVVCLSPRIEVVRVTSIPPTQGKKTMENFQFSSAHNIVLKPTSLTNYHFYLRLSSID